LLLSSHNSPGLKEVYFIAALLQDINEIKSKENHTFKTIKNNFFFISLFFKIVLL